MNCFGIYIKLIHVFDGCSPLNDEGSCIYQKLLHNWHDPYQIVTKLSTVHFQLRTETNRPVRTTVFHGNCLKPHYDKDPKNHTCLTIYCRHPRCLWSTADTINCWTHVPTTTKHLNLVPLLYSLNPLNTMGMAPLAGEFITRHCMSALISWRIDIFNACGV